MLIRKIVKVIRGRATPFQIVLACILGAMIGFVPGFAQGPGLLLALALVLIVLNANLILAALVGMGAKLASLALMPVSFGVGRILLDGPTQPVFVWAINAPVLALFGFEHYATTGGMVVGAVLGLIVGIALVALLTRFRRKMATMEEGSERYKRFTSKRWVRIIAFIMGGKGKGKKTWGQILERKVGNPVRPLGVVFAVLVVGLLFLGQAFLSEPIVTAALHRGLERANGATVDLGSADLSLREGRLTVQSLAMADPEALHTDLFRAATLEASISTSDLLRKRITMESVVARDAYHGEPRDTPGRIIRPRAAPPLPPDPPRPDPDEKTLEDYLEKAQEWKERLEQIQDWLDRVGSRAPDDPRIPPEERETLRDRLRREIEEKGYARVRADHLIEGFPMLLVRELRVEGLRSKAMEGELLDVLGENLSTQPWLVAEAPRVRVAARSGKLEAEVVLAEAAATPADSSVLFSYLGLPADTFASALAVAGEPPLQGGTIDARLEGAIGPGPWRELNLPLHVTVRNTRVSIQGVGSADVERMALPIDLRGQLARPRVRIDPEALTKALADAGASAIAGRVRQEAEKAAEELKEEATERARDAIRRVLPGGR